MKLSVHGRTIGSFAVLLVATLASSCSDDGGGGSGSPSSPSSANTNAGPSTSGSAGPSTTGGVGPTTTGTPAATSNGTGSGSTVTNGGVTNGTTTAGVGGATTATSDTGSTGTPTTGSTSGGGTGGNVVWDFTGPRVPPALGSWPPPGIKLTEVATGANQPTAIAAPRFDPTRLYFTEKWGVIRLIKDGVLVAEPALDIRTAVLEGGPQASGDELEHQGKRGLVGLAFHPDYDENGRIFVMYTADQGIPGYGTVDHTNVYDDGDMTIEEYRRSESDPDKFDPTPVRVVAQWDKGDCDQCSQHNGGSLEIDVNGFLWASSGDPPPYSNPGSQDLNSLNGKLLRFDVRSSDGVVEAGNYPGADPAIASIGIRNAYKFSVDRYTGDLYVGDVGEEVWEEITVERYDQGHKDHGWPKMEGFQVFEDYCTAENCLDPLYDYQHSGDEGAPGADNCIIGGYVYRGEAIPQLQGAYIYGDYGSGKIRALQIVEGVMQQPTPHDFGVPTVFMGCFGEDAAGEMYVCDYNNGKVLRIDAQ